MRRPWWILIIVILVSGRTDSFATAQKPSAKTSQVTKTVHHTLTVDTGKLTVRNLDSAALNKYSQDPDFNYTHEKNIEQQSLWSRFWTWFWRWVGKWLSKLPGGKNAVPVIKYLLIGA